MSPFKIFQILQYLLQIFLKVEIYQSPKWIELMTNRFVAKALTHWAKLLGYNCVKETNI